MQNPNIAFIQVLGRKRDVNGNPFRLVCCYDSSAKLIQLVECRDSCPNFVYNMPESIAQLTELMLTPSEYREVKQRLSKSVELEHSH